MTGVSSPVKSCLWKCYVMKDLRDVCNPAVIEKSVIVSLDSYTVRKYQLALFKLKFVSWFSRGGEYFV